LDYIDNLDLADVIQGIQTINWTDRAHNDTRRAAAHHAAITRRH